MRCPYCNEEMICGSVQSQREIFFTTKPVWHIIALPAGKLLLIIQLKVNRS